MKKQFFLGVIGVFVAVLCHAKSNNISPQDAESLARQAFSYCLATVEHNKMINEILKGIPPNVFAGEAEPNSPEDTLVKFTNNDTYYNVAILDIRSEPVVISIPEIKDRYYNIQMIDMYTNCLEYISFNENGNGPGNFLIVRSDWDGQVPEDIDKVIKSTATVVLAINRTQFFSKVDKEIKSIHAAYKITPLSKFMGLTAVESEPLKWDIPYYDPKTGSIEGFFNIFNQMIAYQLLTPEEERQLKAYSAIGIEPGKPFRKSDFSPEIWEAIETGAKKAKEKLAEITSNFDDTIFGWNFTSDYSGRFGDNYFARAKAAWQYMYANIREEAMYYFSKVDSNNETLNSDNKYVLIFSKEFLPQVKYFWSLTMYDTKGHLVENEINRYSLNSVRSPIKYNEDGTFVLYIQKENPGEDKVSNWLPTPDGEFYLIFRKYGANIKFRPIPPIVRTNKK
ncbi:MAG: DUF1214 domain-containing protein [Prevotellaceae bacterium]|jgi:hypothetical protein|nr:DUF1214 domain-containing protein [Prevotellaceae bacterium]